MESFAPKLSSLIERSRFHIPDLLFEAPLYYYVSLLFGSSIWLYLSLNLSVRSIIYPMVAGHLFFIFLALFRPLKLGLSHIDIVSFALILFMAIIPALYWLSINSFWDSPDTYLIADQPWFYSISQAYYHYAEPRDLGFFGKLTHYHTGAALVPAYIAKFSGLPLSGSFFIVFATLTRFVALATFYLLLRSTCGNKFISIFIGLAFFAYFQHLNLAELIDVGRFDYHQVGRFFESRVYMRLQYIGRYEMSYALALLCLLFVRLRQHESVVICLSFLYFVKPPMFLAAGFCFGLFAVFRLLRRQVDYFVDGVLALLLVAVLFRSLSLVSGGAVQFKTPDVAVLRALEFYFGFPLKVGSLNFDTGILVQIADTWLYAAFFLVPVILARSFGAMRPFALVYLAAIFSLIVLALLDFISVDPAIDAAHKVINAAGISFESEYANAKLINVRRYIEGISGIFGAMLVAVGLAQSKSTTLKSVYGIFSLLFFVLTLAVYSQWRMSDEVANVAEVKRALQSAPYDALYLTNRRGYGWDPMERDRPFRNVLFPAAAGHQFFAANIDYGFDLEKFQRLKAVQAFWSSLDPDGQMAQLRAWGIDYVLFDKDAPGRLDPRCFIEVRRTTRFLLLEVPRDSAGCTR